MCVDIVAHLLDDVDREVGDLLVEDVLFLADELEDADQLRDGQVASVALLDGVFDVEASDRT